MEMKDSNPQHPSKAEGLRDARGEKKPADFIREARNLLRDGEQKQAYGLLIKGVVRYPESVLILSYFGCLQAIVDRKYRAGIDACRKALGMFKAPDAYSAGIIYPILYLNLGRAYIAAGRKVEAIEAFEKGLKYDRTHFELKKEQRLLGIRKPPVVPFLSRSNPINKLIGIILHGTRRQTSRQFMH
jgi:tetratricopeptide (TPR) repeat protein